MSRIRNWCITLRETVDQDLVYWNDICTNDNIKYMVIGAKEKEDSDKNVHRHMYLELKTPRNIGCVKKYIGDFKAHLEPRHGSCTEAKDYVIKEGLFFEFGSIGNKQGNRTDLHNMVKEIVSGKKTLGTLVQEESNAIKYINCITKAVNVVKYEDSIGKFRKVRVIVLKGESGTGKSKRAFEWFNKAYSLPRATGGNIWWDNYTGQDTVLIEDFDGGVMTFDYWKTICDGYPMQVPVKGGFAAANWTTIVITTVENPSEWWHCKNYLDHPKQLDRRITHIIECKDINTHVYERGYYLDEDQYECTKVSKLKDEHDWMPRTEDSTEEWASDIIQAFADANKSAKLLSTKVTEVPPGVTLHPGAPKKKQSKQRKQSKQTNFEQNSIVHKGAPDTLNVSNTIGAPGKVRGADLLDTLIVSEAPLVRDKENKSNTVGDKILYESDDEVSLSLSEEVKIQLKEIGVTK